MGPLRQCWRAVFNLLPLRGRKRRLAKLLVVLLLSAAISLLVLNGACVPGTGRCGEEGGEGFQRVREEFEIPRDYEVKQQNPVLHRNIKGGKSDPPAEGQDSVLDQPMADRNNPEREENQRTQVELPPEPNGFLDRDTGVDGVGEEKELQRDVKSDEEIRSEEKSLENDGRSREIETPLAVDSNENLATTVENDRAFIRTNEQGVGREKIDSNTPMAHEEVATGVVQKREAEEVGLEEGNRLPGPAGKAGVVVKTKAKPNMSPATSDSGPADTVTDSISVKHKVKGSQTGVVPEKNLPSEGTSAPPSLPPEAFARPKPRVVDGKEDGTVTKETGVKGDGGAPGGGVRSVQKESVPGGGGKGEGGGEEEKQISAVEMANAIESGAMCKTVCPPFTWSEWSPCSKACGRGRRYRKALYKFICQTSEHCPLNRIEEAVCETPCKFDPEKYGGPNGLDMYPINPLNPAIYPEDKKYMCGHWLVEYEKLHQEILSGKRPPRYLVYSTGKGAYPTAGGIAPRLRGITTTFFMAVLLDRAFVIDWQDPPGLDQYLEPKSFDWAAISKTDNLKRGPVRDIGSWRSAKESSISSQWYMSTNFSTYFTNEVEIVQGHRYDFTYAVLRNPELMPKAFELGVDRIKCRICCAFHMLFRMTEKFEKQMKELLTSLGAPQKTVGAIQIRAKSNNIQEAVKYVDAFIKCAGKAGKGLKMSNKISWVPIFNNRLVVHIVHKKYGDKLKIPINIDTATRTVHTHLGNLPADTELEVAKAVQERTFKEFFLTINSTVLIRKKGYEGSFGNIADAIRRFYHELGSVHTFLVGNTCSKFPDTYKIE